MNKKIIMLLTNAFEPDPRVYQEAKSLINNGYDITIICWDRDYKKQAFEKIYSIKIERIYVRSTHGRGVSQSIFLFIFWVKAFFRIIKKQFDIIHCHDFDTLPVGFLIGKVKRKAIIYDAHESFSDMLIGSLPKWFIKLIIFTENILIKKINLLITVGCILEKNFQSRGVKKSCVVGNWKDLKDFNTSKEKINTLKKALEIPENKLITCFIGCFTKERMLPELLNAVSLSQNAHLLLGGDGPSRNSVISLLKKSTNITYLGYVDSTKIPLYTSVSDVIIYTFDKENPNSKFSAPNKLFEALAAGRAIISGNFGEIGKIIRKENCGLVLEAITVDSLLKSFTFLCSNGFLKEYQQNAAIAGREKYNWKKAEKILLENYINL